MTAPTVGIFYINDLGNKLSSNISMLNDIKSDDTELLSLVEEDYYDIIWQEIKKINKTLPTYKYIKHLIITEEPMIKTTTQKIKRHEEIKRIIT